MMHRDGDLSDPRIHSVIQYLNETLRAEVQCWESPVDAVLVRTIYLGELEGRLFDVTSLASVTGMTVPTTARRVTTLMDEGLVARQRDGRSFRLMTTSQSRARLSKSAAVWLSKAGELASAVSRSEDVPAVAPTKLSPPPRTASEEHRAASVA